MIRLRVMLLTSLFCAGCASTLPPREQRLLDDCEAIQQALLERRERAMTHGQLEGARALGKAICQLTERICLIAKRNPGSPEARERCQESRDSCRASSGPIGTRPEAD
jgi:hypothetical protein